MASGIYNRFNANLMNKEIDLEGDSLILMLMDAVHSFTAADNVVGDVDANELAAAGNYAQKTATLASGAVTQAATTKFDAEDNEWLNATFSAFHAVVYDDTVGTDDLVFSIDFGGEQQVTAGTFTIKWHSDGIITLA